MNHTRLLSLLKPETEKIDAVMREDLRTVKDSLLSEILHYSIFNGGKRIRPLLCILAARLCGFQDDSIYRLAMAFEYLHVATLLHDDVIDDASTRRGREAANTIWGNTSAILAGDYLHARSMFLVGGLGGRECLNIICRVTSAMVEGEFLQMRNTRHFSQSEEEYFHAIEGKTAVLIAGICEIGAVYAKATEAQRQALRSYGTELGMAFQVVDDLLDYLGDPLKTGKAAGNDFIEGKMTLPLIHALRNSDSRERDTVLSLLAGNKEERADRITTVVSLMEKHNAFHYARKMAEQLINAAIGRLEIFTSAPAAAINPILTGLAGYVLTREK